MPTTGQLLWHSSSTVRMGVAGMLESSGHGEVGVGEASAAAAGVLTW